MYCKCCGAEMTEAARFCPACGKPTSHIVKPVRPYMGIEDVILEAVSATLFGLSMFGGGIYAVFALAGHTKWAIAGGISGVIGGTCCVVKGICLAYRLVKERRHAGNE